MSELDLSRGKEMDVSSYNRYAWNRQVARSTQWTVPVSPDVIRRARQGDVQIVLTPERIVPQPWLGELPGRRVLCLAGGGGQQGPVLAAAGADVIVLDNSPGQLAQDRMVAHREGLTLRTVLGDMADLKMFEEGQFDLIVHPCSNCFAPDVRPVWREAARVLRPAGELLAGFNNPVYYLFDYWQMERGELRVAYQIPFSDAEDLPPDRREALVNQGEPLEFGHPLEDQIGGQLAAGFLLTDMYEDRWSSGPTRLLSEYIDIFIATRATKVSK